MNSVIYIVDDKDKKSVCESLYLCLLMIKKNSSLEIKFNCKQKYSSLVKDMDSPRITYVENVQSGTLTKNASLLNFSERNIEWLGENHCYYQGSKKEDHSSALQKKIEFTEDSLSMNGLGSYMLNSIKKEQVVLTFSDQIAMQLNLQGIPTIEYSKTSKYGSFLPYSLIIMSKSGEERKDNLNLIFDFYKQNKIEDIFLNKGVLEVDWQLIYLKMDNEKQEIKLKRYPVSDSENFIEVILRKFLTLNRSRQFNLDHIIELSQKLDTIDLEVTLGFLKKSIGCCIYDIEEAKYPLVGSYWSLIEPFIGFETHNENQLLLPKLKQAFRGLDMVENVIRRDRRSMAMH